MEIDIDEFFQEEPDELEKNFAQIKKIGSGSFGTVVQAIHKETNQQCAIKVINKSDNKSSIQKMKKEITILKNLNHENIVKFIGYIETNSKLYIIMEFIQYGTLRNWMNEHKDKITEEDASLILKHILNAVQYLHSKDIYHRDIKPENIMFSRPNDLTSLKLIDFGLSSFLMYNIFEDSEYCGTFLYMAPEQIEKKLYCNSVDIWSIGIIMYMLLNNCKHPFYTKGMQSKDYIAKIKEKQLHMINKCSPMAIALNKKLLEFDPIYRYTAEKALKHPWITRKPEDPVPETLEESLHKRFLINKMQKMILTAIFLNSQNKVMNKNPKKKIYYVNENYLQKAKHYSEKKKIILKNKRSRSLDISASDASFGNNKSISIDLPTIQEVEVTERENYEKTIHRKDSSKFKFTGNITNNSISKNLFKKSTFIQAKNVNNQESRKSLLRKTSKTIKIAIKDEKNQNSQNSKPIPLSNPNTSNNTDRKILQKQKIEPFASKNTGSSTPYKINYRAPVGVRKKMSSSNVENCKNLLPTIKSAEKEKMYSVPKINMRGSMNLMHPKNKNNNSNYITSTEIENKLNEMANSKINMLPLVLPKIKNTIRNKNTLTYSNF